MGSSLVTSLVLLALLAPPPGTTLLTPPSSHAYSILLVFSRIDPLPLGTGCPTSIPHWHSRVTPSSWSVHHYFFHCSCRSGDVLRSLFSFYHYHWHPFTPYYRINAIFLDVARHMSVCLKAASSPFLHVLCSSPLLRVFADCPSWLSFFCTRAASSSSSLRTPVFRVPLQSCFGIPLCGLLFMSITLPSLAPSSFATYILPHFYFRSFLLFCIPYGQHRALGAVGALFISAFGTPLFTS